jgi:hypothetical protein
MSMLSTSTVRTIISSVALERVYELYYRFLAYFPPSLHGVVSFALAVLLIYAAYKVIKRNFVYLILLVLLLPQSVPILKTLWQSVYEFLKFLLGR